MALSMILVTVSSNAKRSAGPSRGLPVPAELPLMREVMEIGPPMLFEDRAGPRGAGWAEASPFAGALDRASREARRETVVV